MKTKTSLIATAFTVALFGTALADTTTIINITGSTAGRSTIHTQLSSSTGPLGVLNGNVAPSFTWYKVDGSTAAASSQDGAIYKAVNGVSPNQNTVYVRTYWAGSASGVDYVSNQVQLDYKFMDTSVTLTGAQTTGDTAALTTAGKLAPASVNTVSQFGFSDVKQAATTHQSNALAEQTDMLVLPFRWVKTATTDLSPVTNITSQNVRNLYTTSGKMKLSRLTGLLADETKFVYAVGRDNDSGTRITALAETGTGVFTTLTQYQFDLSDNGTPLDATDDTISNPTEVFDGGYATGGSVAGILGATGFNAIGYVGVSDANTAINNGAVALTYNGVQYTKDALINGQYTFWSKYQAIRKQTLTGPGGVATTTSTLFSSLKTALTGLATGSGTTPTTIKLTDMKCTRASDGAVVK